MSDNETLDDEAPGNGTLSDLTVGDSLTLNCTVTAISSIFSSVNIIWITGGSVVRRVDNITVTYTSNDSGIYTDLFEIPSLTAIDNGREYQCTVTTNASQAINGGNNVTLSFDGKLICT